MRFLQLWELGGQLRGGSTEKSPLTCGDLTPAGADRVVSALNCILVWSEKLVSVVGGFRASHPVTQLFRWAAPVRSRDSRVERKHTERRPRRTLL